MFKFNQWKGEFLNLRCTVHTDDNATQLTVDMRTIYAMHLYFLANAPMKMISDFCGVRKCHDTATRWAAHMIRFYIAVRKSNGEKLADGDAALVGTADKPILPNDPENITHALEFYYAPEVSLANTEKFMSIMRACTRKANDMDGELSEGEGEEGERGGAAFWKKDSELDIEDMDKILELVLVGENSVHTIVSPDGKLIGVEYAKNKIRGRALRARGRETRSMTTGLTVGTLIPPSAKRSRTPASGHVSTRSARVCMAPTTITMSGAFCAYTIRLTAKISLT